MKKIFFTTSIVLALLIANITQVSATQPSGETVFWEGQDQIDCGDFFIYDNWEGNFKFTYYWNMDGTLDRYHTRAELTDVFFNPENGKSVSGRSASYNFFEDWEAAPGVWKHTGLMYHAVLPGVGTVLIDAGYFIMVDGEKTVLKGIHEMNGGDIDRLCVVLQ